MLYKKNGTPYLNKDLFRNPTAEYRGTPFWSWNCKLEQKELEWQLEVFKKMGFGGAHMHVRTGMDTPYLSNEYMEIVKACVAKAKKEEMLAWLYDEDRFPSGFAGGLVTKDIQYRSRYLMFTPTPYGAGAKDAPRALAGAKREENGRLLACYDVELDQNGCLMGWKVIDENTPAKHDKWYAYLEISSGRPWYNNQTYVNTLDKAAMDRFIEVTYDRYQEAMGDEFDKTIPAIFTDEPQFIHKGSLKYAKAKEDVFLPWTDDLEETFARVYEGENLLYGVPELIWERADGAVSVLRYHYHDHICERFVNAFADNCGSWCKEHGLAFTGHVNGEPTLHMQTKIVGEAMRFYRGFGLPGIDMLCAWFEYTTAKQAQSAVHQYGREGMLSELYGVTNWDFDFRGHKLHGDWQAALGVTVRVPHLSWVSMAGEAKRDYPASIHYQSPWWEKYSYVEDHFARLNTALTRGKPIVKVGVIHPIESYWLHWGPAEQTALTRETMDLCFQDITKWLIFGGIDFDFICEALLPELCEQAGAPLRVGAMEYDAILVPNCETLRSTTLERLEQFQAAGGTLIFTGQIPTLEDARPSDRGKHLAGRSRCIPFSRGAILEALEPIRVVELRNENGTFTDNLLYQLRQDEKGCWLFISHGKEPYNKDISSQQNLTVRIPGRWKVCVYDTVSGDIRDMKQCIKDNRTEVYACLYDYDSLLLWLEESPSEENMSEDNTEIERNCLEDYACREENVVTSHESELPVTVPYTLSEPNALLLDQAEYALDDEEWQHTEEILRMDVIFRSRLGWPIRDHEVAQPWTMEEEQVDHMVHLRWHIRSEISYEGLLLAIEDAERLNIRWNGQMVPNVVTGWYVDKAIKTIALPKLHPGENILEADIPFGKRTNLEWAYLLGDFGVEVIGRSVRIIAPRKELAFGDITMQGLPFYGGNITYHIPVKTNGGNIQVHSGQYKGTLQTVSLDGGREIPIIYPPYTAQWEGVEAGKHVVDLTLYGHRRNSFGPVHYVDLKDRWIHPKVWRSKGDKWCYDYRICQEGVMTTPVITVQNMLQTED